MANIKELCFMNIISYYSEQLYAVAAIQFYEREKWGTL